MLKANGIEFCVRLKDNWWLKVKKFVESNDIERIVTLSLPKEDRNKLVEYPHMQDSAITCRLVKMVLSTEAKEILCTSLTDTEKHLHKEFDSLYHYRWNEEETYKLLKRRIELENFSGKTAQVVKQNFHAKVFLMTFCVAYAHTY